MPVLCIVLRVGIAHELVIVEYGLPVLLIFHLFLQVLLAPEELFDRKLRSVEILKNEVLSVYQVCVFAREYQVDQLMAWLVLVLRHLVHYLEVQGFDRELGLCG